MRWHLSYSILILMVIAQSCALSKNLFDKQNLKRIDKHKTSIPELAEYSVSQLGNKNWLEIQVDTLTNKSIKRKIKNLGKISAVHVKAKDTLSYGHNEPFDSTVTFNRTSFFLGVEEIIFDYSKRNRTFPSYVSATGDYKFVNVGNRIYYRRRPFPWM